MKKDPKILLLDILDSIEREVNILKFLGKKLLELAMLLSMIIPVLILIWCGKLLKKTSLNSKNKSKNY